VPNPERAGEWRRFSDDTKSNETRFRVLGRHSTPGESGVIEEFFSV
jgi:hypothetical protein